MKPIRGPQGQAGSAQGLKQKILHGLGLCASKGCFSAPTLGGQVLLSEGVLVD